MELCEFQLYKYMLSKIDAQCGLMCRVMRGKNRCNYKGFQLKVPACRMSGEMCTSLGNGFTNLMVMLFTVEMKGGKVVGVVEGDDGLFATNVDVTSEDITRMGFDIKIEKKSSFREASFCGIVASEDGTPLTDPRKVLMNFGWSHSFSISAKLSTRRGLLRAKALSLLHEHPQCPVLTALALRYIKLTASYKPIWSRNWYERDLEMQVLKFESETHAKVARGISGSVRTQFSHLYDISVNDQLELEAYINMAEFDELDHPILRKLFCGDAYDDCRDYRRRYVGNVLDLIHRNVVAV